MKKHLHLLSAVLLTFGSMAHAETWTLADGSRLVGEVKVVTRGVVVFMLTEEKREEAVEVTRLSDESRRQVAITLGLISSGPAAAPPAPVAMTQAGRDPAALDVIQQDLIVARFGLKTAVVGVVKEVVTLGSSGHKKIMFEGSDFTVFISRRYAEQGTWPLDGLQGKVIQVTGEIAKFQEAVQIAAKEPSQIVILP